MSSFLDKITLPHDKANHFTWGAIITSATFCLTVLLGLIVAIPAWVYWYSFVPGTLIAFLKEVRDKVSKKGTPSRLDFVYTVAGVLSVFIPTIIKR